MGSNNAEIFPRVDKTVDKDSGAARDGTNVLVSKSTAMLGKRSAVAV